MGYYRLFLATLVIVSHADQIIYFNSGYHIGVSAVISFLLMSGFVMTLLLQKYYQSLSSIKGFYFDRILRLMPQYLLYFFATLFCAYYFGLYHRWMTSFPSFTSAVLQLAMLPLNFEALFPSDFVVANAWSLGLEGFFYILFPFVLLFNLRLPVALFSMAVFLLAYSGVINTDLWMYRFLPGTFFIFICGSWIANPGTGFGREIPAMVSIISFILLGITYIDPVLAVPFSRSVLMGIAVGIPIVLALRHQPKLRFDNLAGDISYGVFLNQLLVIAILHGLRLDLWKPGEPIPFVLGGSKIWNPLLTVETFAVAIFASYLTFNLVERPFIKMRRGLRDKIIDSDLY